jgi:hypothetical protein
VSIGWDVVTAVEALIRVAVADLSPPPSVVVQDELAHDTGYAAVPSLIVVGEDEGERELESSKRIMLAYPILVGFVAARGLRREQTQYRKDVRQAVRRALYVTKLAGVPAVVDCETYEATPAFDASSWGDSFKVTAQRFVYLSDEPRNG